MLKGITEKNILLPLFLCGLSLSAMAQNAPHRYAKFVPDGSDGFKAIYFVDTLSTITRLNKKLDTISAAFYQITDSLLTMPTSRIPSEYFSGSLRNSFSQQNELNVSYFIRPNKYNGNPFNNIMKETNNLLAFIESQNTKKRDSIVNSEYKRFIVSRLNRNVLPNGDSCFSKKQAIIPVVFDKKILNADSVIIIQSIYHMNGTCAMDLLKEVILYKKNIGYIGLQYSLSMNWILNKREKISFQEASNLLDESIRQTWGIIRFNKE